MKDPAAEGATPPPRVFVSTQRSWHSETRYRLEYGGTATRGVDYSAPTDDEDLGLMGGIAVEITDP